VRLESQEKVFKVVSDLADTLGLATYEEAIAWIRLGIRELGPPFLASLFRRVPSLSSTDPPSIERADEFFEAMSTKEKLACLLRDAPEPDPEVLESSLKALKSELTKFREILLPMAKRLPHDPGGRPRLFSDSAERANIRKEIWALRSTGVRLRDAQERIAAREGTSLTTIQRIWREGGEKRIRKSKKQGAPEPRFRLNNG
jgi:hypothetical protein